MAIFGTSKKEGKTKGQAKSRHAATTALKEGAAHEIIRAPWLSEKALIGTEKGVYAFAVSSRATSEEIAGAITEIYKVTPRAVRLVNTPGKRKPLRNRRGEGQRAARRKAYVSLNAGDTITLA